MKKWATIIGILLTSSSLFASQLSSKNCESLNIGKEDHLKINLLTINSQTESNLEVYYIDYRGEEQHFKITEQIVAPFHGNLVNIADVISSNKANLTVSCDPTTKQVNSVSLSFLAK